MSSVEPQFGEGGQTWDNNQNFLFLNRHTRVESHKLVAWLG